MPDTSSHIPSFVVVLVYPGAHIGDVIEALRTRHVNALETIHLDDLEAPYPERIIAFPCLLVFGNGKTRLEEARLRQALPTPGLNTAPAPSL